MNGKKAKLLRKLVSYVKREQPAQYEEKFQKTRRLQVDISKQGAFNYISIDMYQTRLEPNSPRAKYQTLKHAVKQGHMKVTRERVA